MKQPLLSRYSLTMIKNSWAITLLGLIMVGVPATNRSVANADEPAGVRPEAGLGSGAPANEVTKFKGKLKGFQNGILHVTRDDGTDVMVQLPSQATGFTFIAQAKPAFLQRGMLVRFSGTFAANGRAIMPIDKVEIFQSINLQNIPGHSRDRFIPGVHAADRHAAKKPVAVGKYTVVGSLLGINGNGGIMVQAGRIPVTAPLAATATFEIRFHNLNLATAGDPVNVAGFYNPPDETRIRGDVITVTTDRVYGEPAEVPPRRSRRTSKRNEKKPDPENSDAEKPAAEKPTPEKAGDAAQGDAMAENEKEK